MKLEIENAFKRRSLKRQIMAFNFYEMDPWSITNNSEQKRPHRRLVKVKQDRLRPVPIFW